jgi:hypothetical protein
MPEKTDPIRADLLAALKGMMDAFIGDDDLAALADHGAAGAEVQWHAVRAAHEAIARAEAQP